MDKSVEACQNEDTVQAKVVFAMGNGNEHMPSYVFQSLFKLSSSIRRWNGADEMIATLSLVPNFKSSSNIGHSEDSVAWQIFTDPSWIKLGVQVRTDDRANQLVGLPCGAASSGLLLRVC